jgi:hypothetical protein
VFRESRTFQIVLFLDNKRSLLRQSSLTAAGCLALTKVSSVTIHLRDSAASTPKTETAIVAARAILLANRRLLANVGSGTNHHYQDKDTKRKSNQTSYYHECRHPCRRVGRISIRGNHNVRVNNGIDKNVDNVIDSRKKCHDLEGGPRALMGISDGSSSPVEAQAGHNLAQSQAGAPARHAAMWMATAVDKAVTKTISPLTDRSTRFGRQLGRRKNSRLKAFSSSNATCRLHGI